MKQKKWIPFNLNDKVRVKLTDLGRKILRERHDELQKRIPEKSRWEYEPKTEDDEGWSTWEAWELMEKLGEHVGMAFEPPFDINIEFYGDTE